MAHTIYKTRDGKRVPSVTTITKLYGDTGGLLYWANQQGLEGKTLKEAYEGTATPGSMVHERVDYWAQGKEWSADTWRDKFSSEEAFDDAKVACDNGFAAFENWAAFSKFEIVAGEVPLVSEKHKFGGRLDAVMTSNGLALADWKTGSGGKIYADFLLQLGGGYAILWDENFPDKPITAGYHVIRFNRETADFAHFHYAELDDARKGFLLLRELYDVYTRLKKRV